MSVGICKGIEDNHKIQFFIQSYFSVSHRQDSVDLCLLTPLIQTSTVLISRSTIFTSTVLFSFPHCPHQSAKKGIWVTSASFRGRGFLENTLLSHQLFRLQFPSTLPQQNMSSRKTQNKTHSCKHSTWLRKEKQEVPNEFSLLDLQTWESSFFPTSCFWKSLGQ